GGGAVLRAGGALGGVVRAGGPRSLSAAVPVRHVAPLSATRGGHRPLPADRALAGRAAAARDLRALLEPDHRERGEVPRRARKRARAAAALRGHPGAAARRAGTAGGIYGGGVRGRRLARAGEPASTATAIKLAVAAARSTAAADGGLRARVEVVGVSVGAAPAWPPRATTWG